MPSLPYELEREIFEWAARTYRPCAAELVLVAKRVKDWIEPILYESIDIYSPYSITIQSLICAVHSKPCSFFAQHVKTLSINNDITPDTNTILSACTGVVNLRISYWALTRFQDGQSPINGLRPRRLSSRSRFLETLARGENSRSFFENVTHLELEDPMLNRGLAGQEYSIPRWALPDSLPNVAYFPSLTHLAVFFEVPYEQCIDGVLNFLQQCLLWEICVILMPRKKEDAGGHNLVWNMRPARTRALLLEMAESRQMLHMMPRMVIMPWHSAEDRWKAEFGSRHWDFWACASAIANRQKQLYDEGDRRYILLSHFDTGVFVTQQTSIRIWPD